MRHMTLKIVINCLGMPFNGNTINTGTIGGSETAAYYMAKCLVQMGHEVLMFTNSKDTGVFDGVKYYYAGEQSDVCPMGSDFHFYAENTPHDILVIQRNPSAFTRKFASKMNFLWLHDLAQPEHAGAIRSSLWNIDSVLCVSEYHKRQVAATYGIPEKVVAVLRNGVDVERILAASPIDIDDGCDKNKRMLYMSRPERGLEHFLKPGGILEQLPDYHLYFCTYNNVTQKMAPYYEHLWRLAEKLPNAHNLGFLTKDKLYSFMKSMGVMVYPTPAPVSADFREVSCIALMESIVAGLPAIVSRAGALPETAMSTGTQIVDKLYDFPFTIQDIMTDPVKRSEMIAMNMAERDRFSWFASADRFMGLIMDKIDQTHTSRESVVKDRIKHSAISAMLENGTRISDLGVCDPSKATLMDTLTSELVECYSFYDADSYAEHYKKYYEYEESRGVVYGPEDVTMQPRFNTVADRVAAAVANGAKRVLDYGCAHGHYTIALAKRFPDVMFHGVDITQSNIIAAEAWAIEEKLMNVLFFCGEVDHVLGCLVTDGLEHRDGNLGYDVIICAEVLEHVRDPHVVLNGLSANAADDNSIMIITTPFGPWEAQGYQQHWPWRAHIHDFNFHVIRDNFSHLPDFHINCVSSGVAPTGDLLGSYVYSYKMRNVLLGGIDWNAGATIIAKAAEQTVALAMIFKGEWYDLARCLMSTVGLISELVIGFDSSGDYSVARDVVTSFARDHHIALKYMEIRSPRNTGFDAARNKVIQAVESDWILWLDSDEIIHNPTALRKYLRDNCYDAYAIKQEHFSIQPSGVLKVDFPCKLFRNRIGVKFIGRIHEHPELAINKGMGDVLIIPDVSIAHYGYDNENTRRSKFARNFHLLEMDRKDYPDREIGEFFWLRDMAQSCMFMLEQRKPINSPEIVDFALKGVDCFNKILQIKNVRMLVESLQFYTTVAEIIAVNKHERAIKVTTNIAFSLDRMNPVIQEISFVAESPEKAEIILSTINKLLLEQCKYDLHLE